MKTKEEITKELSELTTSIELCFAVRKKEIDSMKDDLEEIEDMLEEARNILNR